MTPMQKWRRRDDGDSTRKTMARTPEQRVQQCQRNAGQDACAMLAATQV